jgi:hypothetical protein
MRPRGESRNRATSTGIIPRCDRSPRLIWVSKCWRMTTDGCNDTSEEIAGEQGAGKTTFLRALIHAIPMRERFATLETDQELFAHLMPGRENTLVLFPQWTCQLAPPHRGTGPPPPASFRAGTDPPD